MKIFSLIVKKCLTRATAAPKMVPGVKVTPPTGGTMNILARIAYRWRATRIDQLRADRADIERAITDLEQIGRAHV